MESVTKKDKTYVLFELEFYGPVNIVKVMSSSSVNIEQVVKMVNMP